MIRVPLLLAAALILAAQPAGARKKEAPVATGPVVIDVEAMKGWVRALAADAMEGRAPGTRGEAQATDYIAGQMQAIGLKPAGDRGSWFQDVPVSETRFAAPPALSLSGPGGPVRLAEDSDVVLFTQRTAPELTLQASPVVFVGYGIHAPERGWDDYAGVDVRGKTVLILVNDPDWRETGLSGRFGGRAMTLYGRWDWKLDEAARRGAAAALIVHSSPEAAAYGWDVVRSSFGRPKLAPARPDGGASRPAFEGWITAAAADRLLKPIGGLAKAEAAAGQPGFKPATLPWTASGSARVESRSFASRNVVGQLPGQYRPNETLLVTAHWDHLGRCPPAPDGDEICNGAVDNASGVAGMLALAKALKAAGPSARSITFVAFTGEESGLLGSEWYAAHPAVPIAQTVGGVNIDGLSFLGRTSDAVILGAGKSELEALFAPLVQRQSRRLEPEPNPEKGFYYRSDHYALAKAGVPMLYPKGGVDVRGRGAAYGRAQQADYVAKRYHNPKDEYDPEWDWSGASEDLALDYGLIRGLANARSWPNWLPQAEFRAARDASRAGQPAMSEPSEAERKALKKAGRAEERQPLFRRGGPPGVSTGPGQWHGSAWIEAGSGRARSGLEAEEMPE
jgi:Zn-dependent M28 family amino/carboxypeptidase